MCACSGHPKSYKSCCAAQHASCNAHRSAHRNISHTLVHTLGASGDRVLLVLLLPEKRADGLGVHAVYGIKHAAELLRSLCSLLRPGCFCRIGGRMQPESVIAVL